MKCSPVLLALLVTAVAAVEWLPQEELMKKFPKRFPYQIYMNITYLPDDCQIVTRKGDILQVHYKGTIDKSSTAGRVGKTFDTSYGKDPLTLTLGENEVIRGWEAGLKKMCKGENRTLVVPPSLAYHEQSHGVFIKPGSTLRFEITLVDFIRPAIDDDVFHEIDGDLYGNQDNKLSELEVRNWFRSKHNDTMPATLFEYEDLNEDGYLDWNEFGGPKGKEEIIVNLQPDV